MRVAVVGHVEWVTFARVPRVPTPGEIMHAVDAFAVPAGGGSVAASQLLKLAGSCDLYTALGADDIGRRALAELRELGLTVHAVIRTQRQREAFVHVDDAGERTITVLGPRLGPHGSDPLPWDGLESMDAVFFCAGDDEALRRSRAARVLVATSRERDRLRRVKLHLDAVVGSARDPAEAFARSDVDAGLYVWTQGASGGTYETAEGERGRWDAAPLPGEVGDSYGAGDSFVAGLTHGLAADYPLDDALALAARCGAAAVTGNGPYEGQLSR